jgi:hypothetical protein
MEKERKEVEPVQHDLDFEGAVEVLLLHRLYPNILQPKKKKHFQKTTLHRNSFI